MLAAGYIGRFSEERMQDLASVGLWLGSFLVAGALSLAVFTQGIMASPADDLSLLTLAILMVASGAGFQFKAPTMLGGVALGVYLVSIIVDLAYSPQVAVGIYLAVGGLVLFLIGVALSMFRERLLQLPEQLARREGVFKIIGWRRFRGHFGVSRCDGLASSSHPERNKSTQYWPGCRVYHESYESNE